MEHISQGESVNELLAPEPGDELVEVTLPDMWIWASTTTFSLSMRIRGIR
jgi:hypothetical protein